MIVFCCRTWLWSTINNHHIWVLHRATSQLRSLTTPDIHPTANQTRRQLPLLFCLTCGVHSWARLPLYTFIYVVMPEGRRRRKGRRKTVKKKEIILFSGISYQSFLLFWGQCAAAQTESMFSVIMHCISAGWPFDNSPLFSRYNERIKSRERKRGEESRVPKCHKEQRREDERTIVLCLY